MLGWLDVLVGWLGECLSDMGWLDVVGLLDVMDWLGLLDILVLNWSLLVETVIGLLGLSDY